MFFVPCVTHGMVNRYGDPLPIIYRMCVTGYKEKVGKYAPTGVYARVHYYKRNFNIGSLSGRERGDDEIGGRVGK